MSIGFIVCIFTTNTLIPFFSKNFAARSACTTSAPVATNATCASPSGLYMTCPLPNSNGVSSVVMIGVFSRARRKYAILLSFASARVAFFACIASQGEMTVIRGITRVIAISSIAWCVPPSGPTETPAWLPTITQGRLLYAIVVRICSQLRPGENIAYDEKNGYFPIAAIPEATLAIFCSAIPISIKRSGNFCLKRCI